MVTLKGEEKSRAHKLCYYGPDGTLQKVPTDPPKAEKPAHGFLARIAEQKKEELTDYMQSAAALVHRYTPPDSSRIEMCRVAGKATMQALDPAHTRFAFNDYLQAGDALSIDIDTTVNVIVAAVVRTWLDDQSDAVTLTVSFAQFPDGTIYTAQSVLEAKAKHVDVTVQNTSYRKITP